MKDKILSILKKWYLWVAILVVIIILIFILQFITKPKFQISKFDIAKEVSEYEYSDDSVRYEGKGEITTNDKNNLYLVVVKVILKDGGNQDTEYYSFMENGKKVSITSVLVYNGKGNISTYDYGSLTDVDRPTYDFEIVGSLKLNK